MTAPTPLRPSSLPDAYLALLEQHPELHEAPHHTDHVCLLCERARRALDYRRPREVRHG